MTFYFATHNHGRVRSSEWCGFSIYFFLFCVKIKKSSLIIQSRNFILLLFQLLGTSHSSNCLGDPEKNQKNYFFHLRLIKCIDCILRGISSSWKGNFHCSLDSILIRRLETIVHCSASEHSTCFLVILGNWLKIAVCCNLNSLLMDPSASLRSP